MAQRCVTGIVLSLCSNTFLSMRQRIIYIVLLLFIGSSAFAQKHIHNLELQHHLQFKDSVFSRIRFISGQFSKMPADSVQLYRDVSYPKVVTRTGRYTVSLIFYNDLFAAGYDSSFAGTAVDMLATCNGNVFSKLRFTRDFFAPFFKDDLQSLSRYDIRSIKAIAMYEDHLCIDVMLCIPDSDIDLYYRIICRGGNLFDIEDVCREYWSDEEE